MNEEMEKIAEYERGQRVCTGSHFVKSGLLSDYLMTV
jgi:hypothetical protein